MLRRPALALVMLCAGSVWPALAWTPPAVGQACRGARGDGPGYALIAGTYLGGRQIRHGIVDRKSFQGCFRTVDSCESWLSRHALRYPVSPQVARCTRVTLR